MFKSDGEAYAKGYYDGIQGEHLTEFQDQNYLVGYSDGKGDAEELVPWSDEKDLKVQEAYVRWIWATEGKFE